MREISPAIGMSADAFLQSKPPEIVEKAHCIREQKRAGTRPVPSSTLLDKSTILDATLRRHLLDLVAGLVDENLFGRSEMCMQFATLLDRALHLFNINSRPAIGMSFYYRDGKEVFRWDHAWVRVGDEVIDANIDILHENPFVPATLHLQPYWGPVAEIPSDRRLRERNKEELPFDPDVDSIWWPDLKHSISRIQHRY